MMSSRLHAPRRNSSLRTLAPTFSTIGYHHLILLGPTTQNDELCASRKVKPSLHGICLGEKGLWLWVYSRHDRFTSYLRLLRTKASNLSLWKGKERCESHSTWKERNIWRAELQLQHSFPPIWGLACFHWWRAKGAPELPSIRVSSRRRCSPRGLGDRLNPHS